ncbi:TPA: hypothetical protein DF272_02695 [Candidatus Falkowbacteria bacterium]|nr:hypothetical protein [Candidatus Falkowbacteria bacterium]
MRYKPSPELTNNDEHFAIEIFEYSKTPIDFDMIVDRAREHWKDESLTINNLNISFLVEDTRSCSCGQCPHEYEYYLIVKLKPHKTSADEEKK